MKRAYLLTSTLLAGFFYTAAQVIEVPFEMDHWDTVGTTMKSEIYLGKKSVFLKSGAITTKNVDLKDGIIEVDMSFPRQRSFPGLAFRVQDLNNFENFYVRPHQSGNQDATQYTPVFNGQAGWQLYYGRGYSEAFTFKFDTWHHIKIDVHGLQAEIYVDDMQTPLIKIPELKREWKGGNIALISGGVPVHFANLQYTHQPGSVSGQIPVPKNGHLGLVTQWQVSKVVNDSLFDEYELTPELKKKLIWTTQRSEPSGTVNLSRFISSKDTSKTIVAKLLIRSETKQIKKLFFGFSDYVTVYLNDKIMYEGSDNFMSRDYRFLGTMGFFDSLYLPLNKGLNEVLFVVSEDFGGWGLKAEFENMENISLK